MDKQTLSETFRPKEVERKDFNLPKSFFEYTKEILKKSRPGYLTLLEENSQEEGFDISGKHVFTREAAMASMS